MVNFVVTSHIDIDTNLNSYSGDPSKQQNVLLKVLIGVISLHHFITVFQSHPNWDDSAVAVPF